MDHGQHCRLCQHRLYEIKTGTTCALTGEKPDFQTSCPDFTVGEQLINRIEEVAIEIEQVKLLKRNSQTNFIWFLIVSLSLIAGGWWYGANLYEFGVISTVPLIIMGTGFLVLPLAFGPINNYRQSKTVALQKEKHLQSILKLYGITYETDVAVIRDINGNKEFQVDARFTKNTIL